MKTQTYDVQEAGIHFTQLLKDVASGTDVIIANAGQPIALISRIEASKQKFVSASSKGKRKCLKILTHHYPDDMPFRIREKIDASFGGFQELAITARHAAKIYDLPSYHRDPFDRLLIAQAICEPLKTTDSR